MNAVGIDVSKGKSNARWLVLKIDNLNLITSDFVFSVSYVPLPAWSVKIFLLRSVFLRQKAG